MGPGTRDQALQARLRGPREGGGGTCERGPPCGVPSPAVHELVTVDDRLGLVFDRVDGPWALDWPDAATITARLQADIHDLTAPAELPRLVDTLADLGIDGLPDGDRIFHGDFHPGNVLAHEGHWLVVDWSNAHRAPPAADVACSVLAIGYRGLRDGPSAAHRTPATPAHRRHLPRAIRRISAWQPRRSHRVDHGDRSAPART